MGLRLKLLHSLSFVSHSLCGLWLNSRAIIVPESFLYFESVGGLILQSF